MSLCGFTVWHVSFINAVFGLKLLKSRGEVTSKQSFACVGDLSRISIEICCDGSNDCEDGSDEEDCDAHQTPSATRDFNGGPSYTQLDFKMLETNSSRLHKGRYASFWEKYKPIPVENVPRLGRSVHAVELWHLRAPHSNPEYAKKGWKHEGVGFLLKDAAGRELGRIAYQYWAASEKAPTDRLPPLLLDANGNLTYDEKGSLGFNSQAVVTYSRSRGNWEGGYWKYNSHLSTLSRDKYTKVSSFIEQWHRDHRQFVVMGFIRNILPLANMKRHTNFLHWVQLPDSKYICMKPPMSTSNWQEIGSVLLHQHACLFFIVEVVKIASGIDLRTDHGGTFMQYQVVESVQRFAPAIQAQELWQSSKLSVDWGSGGNSDGLIVIPAWYDSDNNPLEQEDFVEKVHIVRPIRKVITGHTDISMREMKCALLKETGECVK